MIPQPKGYVMVTQWYVTIEGEQKGPLTDSEIRRWVDDGRIVRETFVRIGADGEWQPASDCNGLFEPEQEEVPNGDEGTFEGGNYNNVH